MASMLGVPCMVNGGGDIYASGRPPGEDCSYSLGTKHAELRYGVLGLLASCLALTRLGRAIHAFLAVLTLILIVVIGTQATMAVHAVENDARQRGLGTLQ